MEILIKLVMFITAMFLVVLILLQRGRGGGLAGALGGAGGQSAFGSKAGDVFTRITSGVAIFWIVLCVFALGRLNSTTDLFDNNAGAAATAETESLGQGEEPAGAATNAGGAGNKGTTGGKSTDPKSSSKGKSSKGKSASGGSSTAGDDSSPAPDDSSASGKAAEKDD